MTIVSDKGNRDKVESTSQKYDQLAPGWKMIDDLCGGTRTMREARTEYLPREEKETDKQYEARVKRSFLYGMLKNTINSAVAKPFSQPVTLAEAENLHESLAPIEDSVDREGQSLTSFMGEVFKSALKYNHTYVLVDYPSKKVDEEGNEVERSLREQRDGDIRPYLVHVKPTQLIGIRREQDATGVSRVTMAKIKTTITRPKGEFNEEKVEQILVWTSDQVLVYEKQASDKDAEFVLIEERSHSYGSVPLFPLYLDPEQQEDAELPFEDLAWLNIAHWQSMSDQRNILRVARVPLLLAAGFSKDEVGEGITIGVGRFIRSKNPDAKLAHVEHSGKAIEAGEKDLQRIEERGVILGLQPFVQQTGTQTATGKAIDKAQTHTQIQAWVRLTEAFIVTVYRGAAAWTEGVELPEEFAVSANNDFGFALNAAQDVANLIKMRVSGEITRKTFYHELKRRGFLSEGVNIDTELAELEEEIPNPNPDDVPKDDEEEDNTGDPPTGDTPPNPNG